MQIAAFAEKNVYFSNAFWLYQCWVKYAPFLSYSLLLLTLLILDTLYVINYLLGITLLLGVRIALVFVLSDIVCYALFLLNSIARRDVFSTAYLFLERGTFSLGDLFAFLTTFRFKKTHSWNGISRLSL